MPKVPITKNNYKKFVAVCHGFLIYPKIKIHDILENISIFEKILQENLKYLKNCYCKLLFNG